MLAFVLAQQSAPYVCQERLSRSRVSIAPLPGGFVLQVLLRRVVLSLACTQTLSHLQPCFGVWLGVGRTCSFNDGRWGKKKNEGEGARFGSCLKGAS